MEAADSSEMPETPYQGAWCHPRTAVGIFFDGCLTMHLHHEIK